MRLFFLLLFISIVSPLVTQTDSLITKKRKGHFYANWGYTRAWYSKSTIYFKDLSNSYHERTGKNNYYDFAVYNVTAHDRPDFDKIKDVINITIPQFICRLGYYFNETTGIELNYDHTKYVVTDFQTARVKGQFNNVPVDKDTILDPNTFLHFEHTDGANFAMVNFLKKFNFYNPSKKFNAGWVIKPGAGFVYPRTDVTLFGENLNNDWHVAGWIVGLETGLRIDFLKHFNYEFTTKGSFADYRNVLVLGKGNGKAHHTFWTYQLSMTIGYNF